MALGVVQFNKGAQVLVDVTDAILPCASPDRQLLVLADKMDTIRLRKADVTAEQET